MARFRDIAAAATHLLQEDVIPEALAVLMEPDLDHALDMAVRVGRAWEPLIRALMQKGADVGLALEGESDLYLVGVLLDLGGNIEATGELGQTPLMNAAFDGDYQRIRLLLDRGAKIEARNEHGTTALLYASLADRDGGDVGDFAICVRILLEAGADIHACSNHGWTAVHYAMGHPNAEVVRLLLAAGGDANARTAQGVTPLELLLSAYECPSDDWSAKGKLLLDHGAQVPPRLTDGKATLEVAAEYARDCKVADADVFIAALREHLARTDRA